MSTLDPEVIHKARTLALELVAAFVDRGTSYDEVVRIQPGKAGADYRLSIGGWRLVNGISLVVPPTEVMVYMVDGVTVNQTFNLKELFAVAETGQLSML